MSCLKSRACNFRRSRKEIVVDDCSTDGTGEITSGFKALSLMLIKHDGNYGKGRAIRTGLKACRGDFAIIEDAISNTTLMNMLN